MNVLTVSKSFSTCLTADKPLASYMGTSLQNQKNPLILTRKNLVRASGLSLCLAIGRVQNGRQTSKNSEIL